MEALQKRLTEAAQAGVFGPGSFLRLEINSNDGVGAQFASQLHFFRVILESDNGETVVPILVKTQVDSLAREAQLTDVQFFNEAAMYRIVLPKLCGPDNPLFPKMFMATVTNGENPTEDIVVLEDLRPKGFKVAEDLFLDFDHVALAMRKLGEFHGMSYQLKKTDMESVKVCKGSLGEMVKIPDEIEVACFNASFKRGFRKLVENSSQDSVSRKALEKLLSYELSERWKMMFWPVEPFAVFAHGDFNKNNVLYKYDSNGKIDGIVFFDFGTALYSDPSIDISFFLYCNTSAANRDQHWDEYLSIYWEGVTTSCPEPGFNFDEFHGHFSKKALYGYFPCSFYLPILLNVEDYASTDYTTLSDEVRLEFAESYGGEESTEVITDIVAHLLEKGYLEKFLTLDWPLEK